MEDEEDSSSSKLGTKDFWKEFYETELKNFNEFGDVGEIWFGRENVKRVVKWLKSNDVDKSFPLLDVGCGNGAMLLSLAEEGYNDLVGIDYIQDAVELAANIASENSYDIKYEAADFLCNLTELPDLSNLRKEYKVIIDKGTYDAVGLCPEDGVKKKTKIQRERFKAIEC